MLFLLKGKISMMLNSINSFCTNISPLIQLIGYFILIFKIFLPLILIVVITVDLAKVVVSKKPDELKGCLKIFVLKLGLCILIYFVPMIVMTFMSFVGQFEKIKNNAGLDYNVCQTCMFEPNSEVCEHAVEISRYD